MQDFNRCNKVAGVYWLKKDVRDLQIKIKLKPQDGILTLPKFEDCTKGSNILKLENTAEEHSFKWQEKVFSLWEIQRYTDVHNCITETELNYHEVLENVQYKPAKIFSYIHDDSYLPLPVDLKKRNNGLLNLEQCMEKLNLNDGLDKVFGCDTISATGLFRSEENVALEEKEWTAMHIVFDNSDYNEDSQLIFKQEVSLISIYHNNIHNYLVMMPDVNNLDLNPYIVETSAGVPWGYQYSIEIEFEDDDAEELVTLLTKLYKKWERKQKHLLNFVMPPPGKKQFFVTLEILTAAHFDMDNLYIEFDIKVPEDIQCPDSLHGRTHTSEGDVVEGDREWSYGHIIEFCLEMNTGTESAPIKVFLEAISSDWWGRHRTEGYCYLPLTLDPGCYSKDLACIRPEELDAVEAESRRFFLGGCHLIKDLNVLAEPQLKDANYKYTTTGTISVRWNIVSQAQVGGLVAPPPQPGTSSASALLLGAEAALKKYKKARARLAEATKDLSDVKYAAGDG
ncbi:Meckel syndrome type 1 protein-like [Spodoptera litura]|uniref:Meckel syndrome type 1 protein-like n=1 Tax=Spodoptera litura TaxID=69820 RepID=A0A9J7EPA7_SPOLT|nr:Meckel syndrome type 1 protein-like [Spodoptera litura]